MATEHSVRLGIVTAMSAEAASLGLARDAARARGITVACCGIGPNAATAAATRLLDQGIDALVSWGTAGGLEPGLRAGAVIIADSVTDATSGLRYACDAALSSAVARCSGVAISRPTACVPEPVASTTAKAELRRRFACAAVDMESGSLAAAAAAAGVPLLVVRAIVDPADWSLPDSALAAGGSTHGGEQALRVLRALGQRPWEVVGVIRLALWYRRALAGLRMVARSWQFALADLPDRGEHRT